MFVNFHCAGVVCSKLSRMIYPVIQYLICVSLYATRNCVADWQTGNESGKIKLKSLKTEKDVAKPAASLY